MRCPFCHHSLLVSASECPSCKLTFPRACALLGAVPRLSPVLADTTRSLRAAEHARVKRRIAAIEKRFPQLTLQVVMHGFPAEHPFALHVFWLFNAASFAGESRRGKENHALLLAIDPARGESAIMPGYGLEPFLVREGLDHLLELADPSWQERRWADGILRVLDGIDAWLETISVPEEAPVESGGEF